MVRAFGIIAASRPRTYRECRCGLRVTAIGLAASLLPQFAAAQPAAAQPAAAQPAAAQPAAAQPAAEPRFAVLEYRVTGNSVLSAVAIEEAVYPHLGPGRTVADIERARAALESAYSRAGFSTVSVELPQQRITNGVVTFRVVERPVGRLRVAGARFTLPSEMRRQTPSLAEGTVPNINAVQRDIVALNRSADRRVSPELRAGTAPNTVDVDLRVDDRLPLRAGLELNNRRSANTAPLRLGGNIRYDNLWQRGDSVSFAFQTAPEEPDNTTVFSGSYLWRFPGDPSGPALLASFVRSDSNVAVVGGSAVIGRGTILGLRVLLPLGTGDGFTHTLLFGIDRKDFRQNILFGTDRTNIPITYYPLSASYQAAWFAERTTTQASLTGTFGISGWGDGAAEFERSRAFASPGWSHVRADGAHVRRFANDTQLHLGAQGQLSRNPLISNEQFGAGGLESVRGYLEVEAIGDFGVTGQAELRSRSFAARLSPRVDDLRVHAFVDAGSLGINRPLPQQRASFNLLSAGFGARARLFGAFQGSIEGAAALQDGPFTPAGTFRALFRIRSEF